MTADTPLDICLVSPGLPHDGQTLAERSLGGSETAAIEVARALAARGHFVTVFSPGHTGGRWDDVTYLPIEQATGYLQSTPHDVTVISRAIEVVPHQIASAVRILWCHDLALKRQRNMLGMGLWNLDAIYVLSAFHRAQYAEVHAGLPPEFLVQTRNGVRLADFAGLDALRRYRGVLVYGSRPERGLETALRVMAELARRGSDLRLRIAGYDNPVPHLAGYVGSLQQFAGTLPNVEWLGPLPKRAWRETLATAGALLYPGPPSHSGFGAFREISCLAVAEAQAAGTPVIAVAKGAVPETLGDGGGVLLGDEATDCLAPEHIAAVADACEAVTGDDLMHMRFVAASLVRAQALDWDGVAAQWEADWLLRLQARCANPQQLDAHLRRVGDHDAADWTWRE